MEQKALLDQNEKELVANHVEFLWSAAQHLASSSDDSIHSLVNIQSNFINSCKNYQDQEDFEFTEKIINKNEMCPYCFCYWKRGCYQMKTIPKVKRKGKYKITVIELLCEMCNKKTKITSSKRKRSQVKNISDAIHCDETEKNKKKKRKMKSSASGDLQVKKKINNEPIIQIKKCLITTNTQQKKNKSINIPKDKKQSVNSDKQRLKFAKHLNNKKQTTKQPSALESFLSSVQKV